MIRIQDGAIVADDGTPLPELHLALAHYGYTTWGECKDFRDAYLALQRVLEAQAAADQKLSAIRKTQP